MSERQASPRLSDFILEHLEPLLDEWVSFARTVEPPAWGMTERQLRNRARGLLESMAHDMTTAQSREQRRARSRGAGEDISPAITAVASDHARERMADGFDLMQMVSEYRALRRSVVNMWTRELDPDSRDTLDQVARFDEAMDHSLYASIESYSSRLERAMRAI